MSMLMPMPMPMLMPRCRCRDFQMAVSLQNQLEKNEPLLNEYEAILKEYLKNDIIEKVEEQNDNTGLGNVHYLPHRPVIKPNRETTKVHIVFDASAQVKNEPCLNDILEPGPSLIPLIFDILLRFCTGKIALIADMKQTFLQINTSKEHRDLLRFIWFERDHFNERLVTFVLKELYLD